MQESACTVHGNRVPSLQPEANNPTPGKRAAAASYHAPALLRLSLAPGLNPLLRPEPTALNNELSTSRLLPNARRNTSARSLSMPTLSGPTPRPANCHDPLLNASLPPAPAAASISLLRPNDESVSLLRPATNAENVSLPKRRRWLRLSLPNAPGAWIVPCSLPNADEDKRLAAERTPGGKHLAAERARPRKAPRAGRAR